MSLSEGKAAFIQLPNGKTPLHVAAHLGHISNMRLLIAYGAPVNLQDQEGFTPLHYAALSDSYDAVELLLLYEHVKTGITNNEGKTPLSLAPSGSASQQLLVEASAALVKKTQANVQPPSPVAQPKRSFLARFFCGA